MRKTNRLTARQVATAPAGKRYADGGGLYLNRKRDGARWEFQFTWRGRDVVMGLGSATALPLAAARELAASARTVRALGRNPLEEKRKGAAERPTFGTYAEKMIAKKQAELHNPRSFEQWAVTLRRYCTPFWGTAVSEIATEDVLQVLKPIWTEIPETASRLRGRIEAVIDSAMAMGDRSAANPARWKGHLKHLLPERKRLSRGHHAALPYPQMPEFMAQLAAHGAIAARALEFAIFTAGRSGEVRGARWSEIDTDGALWIVPHERMKARKEHRVPLSPAALAVLKPVAPLRTRDSDLVFPGARAGRPLSDMAILKLLERMKYPNVTGHGFRSSFRDWASEQTDYPHEVCEMALAHTISNKSEAAYRRGDLFEKRRKLMDAWAAYCTERAHG